MEFKPYKDNEYLENSYYKKPQELFVSSLYKNKLNSDSKILYAFLLDRLSLSQKNHWIDEERNIYLIFTREEVQEKLNLSDKTVTKAFKQLNETGLVQEYKKEIHKLQQENKQLNKMIDKFKVTLKRFIKWICHKFSYPSEDELVRDFEKEIYTNFNFEKQLNINQFKKKDDDFDIEY